MSALIVTLLSAAGFYLAHGLDNVWWLAWLAPVPLLWLAYGKAPNWQLWLSGILGVSTMGIYAIQCYGRMAAALIVVIVCLFPVSLAFARWVQRRAGGWPSLLAFPAGWTGVEYLLSLVSPHGTNGSFAYSQMSAPVLIQSASLAGLYAVTFLICLFASAVALALRREARGAVIVGLAVCAANLLFGLSRLTRPTGETLRVASIVDEPATNRSWDAKSQEEWVAISSAYAADVLAAAAEGARFVVMPEGAVVYRVTSRGAVLAPLQAAVEATGVHLIVGVVENGPPDADLAYSIVPGAAPHRYTKRHLVPYLETHFTPGTTSGWLGGGQAVEICKDMDFSGTIRQDALKGARLMGVPAGDFGQDGWIHGRIAVMRGVEDGFALVRAAHRGLATVSDAEGRLVASRRALADGPTIVVADVPLGPGPTLYARIGDVFPRLCLVGTALIAGLALARRNRTPNTATP